jgi:hypothetical protein
MKNRSLISSTVFAALSGCAFAADFSVKDSPDQGHLDIVEGGRILGRYMYERDTSTPDREFDTAKTFLHVFDAEGKAPITKGAGGSFPHHRGIYIGWNRLEVNGKSEDLWHVKGTEQVHQEFLATKQDASGAGVKALVHWNGKGGKTLLKEERVMLFGKAPSPAYALIDFSSTMTAVAGETTLGGDPEHAGLQFRPAEEVDKKKTRFLFPKENADPQKDLDYPWVVESFTLGRKEYQVIYLNHPDNPRDTRFSAYRDYGRFGAFFRGTIPEGESMTLKVRFLVVEGKLPTADWIQEQSNTFTGLSEATPATTQK